MALRNPRIRQVLQCFARAGAGGQEALLLWVSRSGRCTLGVTCGV
jgi:hypothetical protein